MCDPETRWLSQSATGRPSAHHWVRFPSQKRITGHIALNGRAPASTMVSMQWRLRVRVPLCPLSIFNGEDTHAAGGTPIPPAAPKPPLQATLVLASPPSTGVSGMVDTMMAINSNGLVYHRNGTCAPGSLPFLNVEARASRSPHNQGSRVHSWQFFSTLRITPSRTA